MQEQLPRRRTISNTIGHKKSPLGKIRAEMVQDSVCGGLLARIRLTGLRYANPTLALTHVPPTLTGWYKFCCPIE
ncbi:MAG: hypothetical protein PHF31_05035 [Methylobacter sp.]|nr:hypothetical protein [Methylobacter sp.]